MTEVSFDGLPYIEVEGIWPDGTHETVQVPFETSSPTEFDSTWKELQDAMKEFGWELDRSESRLHDAYDRLKEIPEGVHIDTGPLKIRIAA